MDKNAQISPAAANLTGLAGLVVSAPATPALPASMGDANRPPMQMEVSDEPPEGFGETSTGVVQPNDGARVASVSETNGPLASDGANATAPAAQVDPVLAELAVGTVDDVFGPKVHDRDTPFLSIQALEKAAAAELERIQHAKDRKGREAGITQDERDAQRTKRIDEFTRAVMNARQDERKPIVLPPVPPAVAETTRLEIEAGRKTSAMHAERQGRGPIAIDRARAGVVAPKSTPVFRPLEADEMKSGFKTPREGNIRPGSSRDL